MFGLLFVPYNVVDIANAIGILILSLTTLIYKSYLFKLFILSERLPERGQGRFP